MNEFYILLVGMASGSFIGFIGVYIGVCTFKNAVKPFLDLTPVESLNTIKQDNINNESIEGLDWDEYDKMLQGVEDKVNEN